MMSDAGLGVAGVGARPILGAAFGADRLRRGALRALVFLAGRDFLAIFRRADFRADAFFFEDLEADFFRRGAFRLDAFLATVSPPLQHMFGNRTQYITRVILCQDGHRNR
ncbi:MAG: hypothetical protein AUI52_03380 [Acidobacteria bacterium 13_1_40CM_2_68_10]|nr:MAG: hypothetical protein AUI52_03380 [Acidobacteria bacterium 13_1_40CM_2_68_10]